MLTQPERDLIFSLTTGKKIEILENENQAKLFSDLLKRLNSIGESATASFLMWMLPTIEEAKDFVCRADSSEGAEWALKCWAYEKGWEVPLEGKDVNWFALAATLWEE